MKTSAKQLGNEPAHPTLQFSRYSEDCPFDSDTSEGLTKREYFTAMVLQGLLAKNGVLLDHYTPIIMTKCVEYADALLEELAK